LAVRRVSHPFREVDKGMKVEVSAAGAKEVLDGAKEVLDGAKEVLDEAKEVLDEAEEVLDGAKEVLDEAEEVLDEAEEVLDEAEEVLDEGRMEEEGFDPADSSIKAASSYSKLSNNSLLFSL
jgi:methyl-accepting chemotaxis protein